MGVRKDSVERNSDCAQGRPQGEADVFLYEQKETKEPKIVGVRKGSVERNFDSFVSFCSIINASIPHRAAFTQVTM